MSNAADLPHLAAVCLLDAYSSAHGDGNSSLKSSMWKLSKARRQRGNGTRISALDVREELRARAILKESTPGLVDAEGTTSINNEQEEDYFVLVDAVEELAEKRAQKENDVPTKSNAGLRHRNNKQDSKSTAEWTEEQPLNEDDLLKIADPVDLFGAFPPRDLIASQKDAKKALAEYVEAANLARAILQVTNQKK
jgi:hypothetical protein